MSKENKKQHYIPQCYCRNFSENKKSIWVYNKKNSKSYTQSIANIAYEDDFYKLADKVVDGETITSANMLEKEFFANNLEIIYSDCLKLFASKTKEWLTDHNNNPVIDKKTKDIFSALIALQYLRMPNIREMHIDANKKAKNYTFELFKDFYKTQVEEKQHSFVDSIALEYDEELQSLEHFYIYGDQKLIDSYQDQLVNKIWIFYVTEHNNVYTSDNPILTKPHIANQPYLYSGFGMNGVEVIFPLNSSLVLTIWDEGYFIDKRKFDNTFCLIDAKSLREYNLYQYMFSNSETYCINDNFNLIRAMVHMNEGKEHFADRPRIYVNGK